MWPPCLVTFCPYLGRGFCFGHTHLTCHRSHSRYHRILLDRYLVEVNILILTACLFVCLRGCMSVQWFLLPPDPTLWVNTQLRCKYVCVWGCCCHVSPPLTSLFITVSMCVCVFVQSVLTKYRPESEFVWKSGHSLKTKNTFVCFLFLFTVLVPLTRPLWINS